VGKSGGTLLQSLYPMRRWKHTLAALAKETYDFSMYLQCRGLGDRALERESVVGSRACHECRGQGSICEEGFMGG
jgi:hypothetical protein